MRPWAAPRGGFPWSAPRAASYADPAATLPAAAVRGPNGIFQDRCYRAARLVVVWAPASDSDTRKRTLAVVAEGSSMHRISKILTLVVLVSAAGSHPRHRGGRGRLRRRAVRRAGRHLPLPCRDGRPVLRRRHQAQGAVAELHDVPRHARAALPPGPLDCIDEGVVRGTPTHGRELHLLSSRSPTTAGPAAAYQAPSDRKFTINVNPQVLRAFVSTNSLPDANIGQAYTAPALDRPERDVPQLVDARRRHAAPGPDPQSERPDLGHADGQRPVRLHGAGQRVAEQRHEVALDLRARTARAPGARRQEGADDRLRRQEPRSTRRSRPASRRSGDAAATRSRAPARCRRV